MAQTIKLKRSATAGAAPTTSQLELGEVAINTFDGKMYIKKDVGGTESIVEISGSGGGATAADAILEEYLYTATNNQTAFSGNDDNSTFLQYSPGAIQVFLNGVLLDPETDYTATNGLVVTLTSGAATNDYLQIFAFKKKIGDGNVTINTFSGNNSTTAFTLTVNPGDENNTLVFIDGVYQSKSNYSVNGTTLTFSSAPPSGTGIEVEIGNRAVSLDTTTSLDLPDDVKLRLGTALDLEIYHDGSNSLINDNGTGSLKVQTGGSTKLEVTSTGVDVTGNIAVSGTVDGVDIAARNAVLTSTTTTAGAALPRTGGAMTGAITTNSTFDGRDVATDGAKLDGIEAGATADQTQSEINALGITATGLSGTPAISVANITTTGELRGPASFVVDPAAVGDNTGTVVIKGNLQVDGATTTINSTTLTVDDLNITLASGAANGTAANGAGITVDGASATITYNSTGDSWNFNKDIDVAGGIQVTGNISNTSGDLTLDVAGDIILDADGGDIVFRDAGASKLFISNASDDVTFTNGVQDKDLIFKGYDGTSLITALTLNMSEAGEASFGSDVLLGDSKVLRFGADQDLRISFDGSNGIIQNVTGDSDIIFKGKDGTSPITALTLDMSAAGAATFNAGATFSGDVGIGTTAVNDPGFWYDATNDYLAISHWANPPTPAAMLHLSDNSNNLDVPQIRIEGRENPGDTRLDIAVKDPQIRFNLVENSTDAAAGYGQMIFKTNAAANSSHPTRGGFEFQTVANPSSVVITNTGLVGIGGTPATARLEVTGAFAYASGANSLATTVSKAAGRIRGSSDASTSLFFGSLTNDAEQYIQSSNGAGTAADDLVLNPYGGNVGIGTSSPTSPLTVTKDSGGIATFTGISSGGVSSVLMKQSRGSIASPSNSSTAGDGNYIVGQVYSSGYATIGSIGIITGSALNNGEIQFNTASSGTVAERMRISSAGKVGINTDSPYSLLHIYRTATDAYTPTAFNDVPVLTLMHTNADTQYAGIRFSNTVGNYEHFFGSVQTSANTADMVFQGYDRAGNAYKEYLRITDDGKVGIGTADPEAGLHVVGGIHMPNASAISFDQGSGTLRNAFLVDSGDDIIIGDTNFDDIYFSTGQKTKTVVIKQTTGNVGIGTDTPGGKLDIQYDMDVNTGGVTALSAGVTQYGSINFTGAAAQSGGATGTSMQGLTWQVNDYGGTTNYGVQAQLVVGNNGSVGTFMGLFTSASYSSAPVERLRIASGGDVGIGTTSPATPLHVRNVGNPNSGGNRNTVETVLTLDSTGHYPYTGYGVGIDFKGEDYGNTALREYAKIQAVMTDSADQNASGDPSFRSALTFWTNTGGASSTVATEKMRIDSNGNVGIGTAAPSSKLVIYNNLVSGNTALHVHNDKTGDAALLRLEGKRTSSNDTAQIVFANDGSIGSTIRAYSGGDDGDIRFYTSVSGTGNTTSESMRIEAGGDVGIGTNDPTARLTVSGQITGGFGAMTTVGTADWNHGTNARSGMGYTLLLGSATNGPGGSIYYHPVNYEYITKNGNGNMTQLAIPYTGSQQYIRYRYGGTWSSWSAV